MICQVQISLLLYQLDLKYRFALKSLQLLLPSQKMGIWQHSFPKILVWFTSLQIKLNEKQSPWFIKCLRGWIKPELQLWAPSPHLRSAIQRPHTSLSCPIMCQELEITEQARAWKPFNILLAKTKMRLYQPLQLNPKTPYTVEMINV